MMRFPTAPGKTHTWRLRLSRHRRPLAALLAALSTAFALAALRPDDPEAVHVLIAVRDLPSGTTLRQGDLRSTKVPPAVVPDGALRRSATGRLLAGPMRRGEILTDTRLLTSRLLKGYGPDTVATPIRPADPGAIRLLRPGHRVDVLATDAPPLPDDLPPDALPPATDPRPQASRPAPTPHYSAPEHPDTPPATDPHPQTSPPAPTPHYSAPHHPTDRPHRSLSGDGAIQVVAARLAPPSATHSDVRVVATGVPVIAVIREDTETGEPGGLVVLATTREQAATLAGAAGSRLSVTIVAERTSG